MSTKNQDSSEQKKKRIRIDPDKVIKTKPKMVLEHFMKIERKKKKSEQPRKDSDSTSEDA